MAFIIDTHNTKERQNNGIWADYAGGKFLIASSGSMKFSRELSRLQAPFRKKIDNHSMDPQDSLSIMCKAVAAAILLDWENLVDDNGNNVPYNKQTAEQLLESMDDLREFVIDFATNLQNYKSEFNKEVGN